MARQDPTDDGESGDPHAQGGAPGRPPAAATPTGAPPTTAVPAWLPNAISAIRIALIPLFIHLAAACQEAARMGGDVDGPRLGALATLAALGLSDLLDGYLARTFGLTSQLGAYLDALADKLAQVGLLLFFSISRGTAFWPVPMWFFWLVLGADVFLLVGIMLTRWKRGAFHVVHRFHGKAASVLIFVLLVWLTLGLGQRYMADGLHVLSLIIVASTVAYGFDGVLQFLGRRPVIEPVTEPPAGSPGASSAGSSGATPAASPGGSPGAAPVERETQA